MGDLISLHQKKQPPSDQEPANMLSELLGSFGEMLESHGTKDGVTSAMGDGLLFSRITLHLKSLRGRPSKESIAIARNSLKGFSKEELKDIARASVPTQWTARPGYFQALVDEFTAR